MLEAANTDLFNPLVPDAHYNEHWDKLASLQNELLENSWW